MRCMTTTTVAAASAIAWLVLARTALAAVSKSDLQDHMGQDVRGQTLKTVAYELTVLVSSQN